MAISETKLHTVRRVAPQYGDRVVDTEL